MDANDELTFAPAHRLLVLLEARKVSAAELASAFLDKIGHINPRLNAVVTLAAERAMEEARQSDLRRARGQTIGPLDGLPITIKDSVATEGIRSTSGTRGFEQYIPSEDAAAVARLRSAGAIVIGKTNVPELAADVDC